MADFELDFPPRLNGRAQKPLAIEVARELCEADLALLGTERGIKSPAIAKIRERHHALARCLATGMTPSEASAITGYDPSRISILKSDPTFQELVAHYQSVVESSVGDFVARATAVSLTALNEIQERLEDAPEDFTSGQLLEVVKVTADRVGHAPVQRSIAVSANVELGGRLNAAKRRLAQLESVVSEAGQTGMLIEGESVVVAGK